MGTKSTKLNKQKNCSTIGSGCWTWTASKTIENDTFRKWTMHLLCSHKRIIIIIIIMTMTMTMIKGAGHDADDDDDDDDDEKGV